MKLSINNENNGVLNENSVKGKPCINRESKSESLKIQLYSCYDINMKLLEVVTSPSIYHIRLQKPNTTNIILKTQRKSTKTLRTRRSGVRHKFFRFIIHQI